MWSSGRPTGQSCTHTWLMTGLAHAWLWPADRGKIVCLLALYIPCHGLDTGILTGACSCRNTHTVVLHLVSGFVTGLVVAVASSSVRSIGVPLFFLKAFTISSLSCWALCPTPCFLSSEMLANLTAFYFVESRLLTPWIGSSWRVVWGGWSCLKARRKNHHLYEYNRIRLHEFGYSIFCISSYV